MTARQLWLLIFCLFLVHLFVSKQFSAWGSMVEESLLADVVYVFVLLVSLILAWLASAQLKSATHPCSFVLLLVWFFFVTTSAWHSMLKICVIHGLDTTCWHSSACPEPKLEGFGGFIACWAWVPLGLLRCIWGTWWRPWWFVLSVLPRACIGRGPLWEGIPWWQWRELLVGGTLMPSSIIFVAWLLFFERSGSTVSLAHIGLFASLGVFVAAIPFYLTTEPMLEFWGFVARPPKELVHAVAWRHEAPRLSVEEWLALFVMFWWLCRLAYIAASLRLEEWNARQQVEEGLRYALEHPFRAELESGFGLDSGGSGTPSGASLLQRTGGLLHRTWSGVVGTASLQTSTEKRKRVREACREWRGNDDALPSSLSLKVRRTQVLEESMNALYGKTVSELLAPSMSVKFVGEMGVDAGGLSRDWFESVARALAEGADDVRGSSLLAYGPDQTLVPRPVPASGSNKETQAKFRALLSVGRFLGLAIYREQPVPLSFSLVAYKYILGVPVGMADVQRLDPDFFRGRVEAVLKKGGLKELEEALGEPLHFTSAPTELSPEPVELKPGGASIAVTDENKTEYVQLLCEAYLCGGIRREIQCLLRGFWDVLPQELLKRCQVTPRELSLLVSGIRNLDVEDWFGFSRCDDHAVARWFWEIVRDFNEEQRCMLLHFATGSSRLPLGGFAELQPTFCVTVSHGSEDRLPVAHTCSNQLVLQPYTSKEQLREKLLLAMESAESFELV